MVDPQRELVANIDCLGVGCRPELLEGCPLYSLDLSVQVRRAWRDRPEPNGLIHQTLLDLFTWPRNLSVAWADRRRARKATRKRLQSSIAVNW